MTAPPPIALGHQSCVHHAAREAVARCPECGRFFCRECIVEHEYRMICAGCLAALAGEGDRASRPGRRWWRLLPVFPVIQAGAGILVAWLVCYFAAQMLIDLPSDFHDGVYFEQFMDAL